MLISATLWPASSFAAAPGCDSHVLQSHRQFPRQILTMQVPWHKDLVPCPCAAGTMLLSARVCCRQMQALWLSPADTSEPHREGQEYGNGQEKLMGYS